MDKELCLGCMDYKESKDAVCKCGYKPDEYEMEPHHLKPGTLLKDRYQVGKVMGEGGFGITYVGRDTLLDLKIAVKEFYMTGYVNRNNTYSTLVRASAGNHTELFEKNKEKFLTEARVLAKFADEEGIVGIRDFFQENNTAYIVMDFLTGETLRDYLKANKKIAWDKTLEIMNPVLKSLGNVHKMDVIHRDISPDNIMLLKDGRVKLLDFGAARVVSQTDIKSLSVILKPGYAPEEQYRSKGQQGPWTDIYALCATLYCCITGTVPEDSMERMFEDKLTPPCELEPTCSKALSNVIMKGMAVRQKDRYQSLAELRTDLDKAVANPQDETIAAPAKAADAVAYAVERGASAGNNADANATVFAGEIKDAVASNVADANATVFAGEIKDAANVKTVDRNATVFAGEIKDAVSAPQEAPKPQAAPQPQVQAQQSKPEPKPQVQAPVQQAAAQQAQPQQQAGSRPQVAPQPQMNNGTSAVGYEPSKKPKKKSGKKVVLIIVAAVVVLFVGILAKGCSKDKESKSDYVERDTREVESGQAVKESETEETLDNAIPYEDFQKCEITLNGTTITLPASYQDFVDAGWELYDLELPDEEVAPKNGKTLVELINVEKGFGTIDISFWNPTSSYKACKDCLIYQIHVAPIDLKDSYGDAETNEVSINGHDIGDITLDYFKEFYPKPDDKSTSSFSYGNRTKGEWFYEYGFYGDDLLYVNMVCNRLPEDYTDTYINGVPAYDEVSFDKNVAMDWKIVLETEAGGSLDVTSSKLVQDYLSVGWTLVDGLEFLGAGKDTRVHLRLDARTTIEATAFNPYKDATGFDYCMISDIVLKTSDLQSDKSWSLYIGDAEIPADCLSTETNFKKWLDEQGIAYEGSVDSYLVTVYPNGEAGGQKVEVWFSSAASGVWKINFSSYVAAKEFFCK